MAQDAYVTLFSSVVAYNTNSFDAVDAVAHLAAALRRASGHWARECLISSCALRRRGEPGKRRSDESVMMEHGACRERA